MKKLVAVLCAALILCLAGCEQSKAPIEVGGVSDPAGSEAVDAAFLERYVTSLEVCLTGSNELVFDDVNKLTSETLLRFFLYAINSEQDPEHIGEQWLESDGKYHVPTADIEEVLGRYFERQPPFQPEVLSGYSAAKDEFVFQTVTGFGGDRYVKLLESEREGSRVQLTVGFYTDGTLSTLQYTKRYTLEEGEENYRYLQVTKEYPEEKSAISYVGIGEGIVGYTQDMAFYSASGGPKMEKYVREMSPSEVLSSEYRVYSESGEVTTVRLDDTLVKDEVYRSGNTTDAVRFTEKAKSLGTLYLSGNIDPLPRPVTDLSGEVSETMKNRVRQVLSQNGATRAEANITKALSCDTDGDGTEEIYLCANSKRSEGNNLPIGVTVKENGGYQVSAGSGIYSLVLRLDGETTEVVDSKFLGEGEHLYNALIFSVDLLGIFDINGDGEMELCVENKLFDTSVVEVLQRTEEDGYRTVLYNDFR